MNLPLALKKFKQLSQYGPMVRLKYSKARKSVLEEVYYGKIMGLVELKRKMKNKVRIVRNKIEAVK